MIDLKTRPLIEKINVLEKVNRQLTNDLYNLEQYSRISLIRKSGIPEPVGEVDTTETVHNLISETTLSTNQQMSSDHIELVKFQNQDPSTARPGK